MYTQEPDLAQMLIIHVHVHITYLCDLVHILGIHVSEQIGGLT